MANTYSNTDVALFLANFGANSLNTTGNIRANTITGNGAYLRSIVGANVIGAVPYATIANNVSVSNVTGIGNVALINKDGNASNVLYGNGVFASVGGTSNSDIVAALANFGSNVINTTGNITGGKFIGNGATLSNITGANVSGQVPYANIANRVAVANVQGIGNIATINRDGNASNVLYGNGVFAAAPNSGATYNNANVATFLANFGSNTIKIGRAHV